MATIAIPRPIPPHRPTSSLDVPITPPLSLESLKSSQDTTIAVPNKHIPNCPTGPAEYSNPVTPPESPRSDDKYAQTSILYPALGFNRIDNGHLSLFQVDAATVADALNHTSKQPLPDPSLVFPWLHGLHPQNLIQQSFFAARRRFHTQMPSCVRGVTVVKADGDLNVARLKGAIAPQDILQYEPMPEFLDDPKDGFSVRNFHLQSHKMAILSDIVVYGPDENDVRQIGWDLAAARKTWRDRQLANGQQDIPEYNTFICTTDFTDFEENHLECVCSDSQGQPTGSVLDLAQQERNEMWIMTRASEISHNVFLGPSPDFGSLEEQQYDLLIECSDLGQLNTAALEAAAQCLQGKIPQPFLDFPSSGSILPPTWTHTEADGILDACRWVYHLSHGTRPNGDADGDHDMGSGGDSEPRVQPRKILIHCADGYTESSLLAIAYYCYSTGRTVPEAWLSLHTDKGRNFFAYPTDVALLTEISPRLLLESPACAGRGLNDITNMVKNEPCWFTNLDGSLPSRIMDYLYLGNLAHANNPDLLRELGIKQILSVGETTMWREGDEERWGRDNVCLVQGVQDNGIDPLTDEFARCLEFIERGRRNGTATLVHCRVGVSRSATICIAEVMREKNLSFPRAYCFVRARRLNVIIQPHLRFAYELLKWEETLQQYGLGDTAFKRELEWAEIAREIAMLNRPYAR